MNAFFPVKGRHTFFAVRNRLAGADFDTELVPAALANFRMRESYMVRIASRGLDFPAFKQRILLRHEQLAVKLDFRETGPGKQLFVQRHALTFRLLLDAFQFGRFDPASVKFFETSKLFVRGHVLAGKAETALGKTGDRHAQQSGNHAVVKAVPRFFRRLQLFIERTRAASGCVCGIQVLLGEILPRFAEFEHCLRQKHPAGPCFIHTGTGKHIRRARSLADPGVSVPDEKRLTQFARFLQRLRAPGAQFCAFQPAPKVRMLHPKLQITVRSARGVGKSGRNKNAERCRAFGVHIKKTEYLRLRIAERVQHGARLERTVFGETDNKLRAYRPVMLVMPFRKTELLIKCGSHRPDRPVGNDGKRRVDIHTRHVAVSRRPAEIRTLIHKTDSLHPAAFEQRLSNRHSRPDLSKSGTHNFGADPLIELPERKHQALILAQERWNERELETPVSKRQDAFQQFYRLVLYLKQQRAPARVVRIEEIDEFFFFHVRSKRNLRDIEVGKAALDSGTSCHYAADAESQAIGAFIANDLQRHPRHHPAFDCRRAVTVKQSFAQRMQEACAGGTETDTNNVDIHCLTIIGVHGSIGFKTHTRRNILLFFILVPSPETGDDCNVNAYFLSRGKPARARRGMLASG